MVDHEFNMHKIQFGFLERDTNEQTAGRPLTDTWEANRFAPERLVAVFIMRCQWNEPHILEFIKFIKLS